MKLGPRGVEAFKAAVCSKCQHRTIDCQEDVEACILAEISYNTRMIGFNLKSIKERLERLEAKHDAPEVLIR